MVGAELASVPVRPKLCKYENSVNSVWLSAADPASIKLARMGAFGENQRVFIVVVGLN
jgi:hypothetical protein